MWKPIQIGLTGSIGMGKSTASNHFRSLGFPVFDADTVVHQLYSRNGKAVGPIREIFPEAVVDHGVDRAILSRFVLSNNDALSKLEGIIHPLVADERRLFLENAISERKLAVVYDIPLLLENPTNHSVDYTVVVTASEETQRARVLSRPGMTEEKFESILSKQMPDEMKRSKADFVVNTDYPGYCQAKAQIAILLESVLQQSDDKWKAWLSLYEQVPRPLDSSSPIRHAFDAIIFDLDDTLVPVMGPIMDAHRAYGKYVETYMSATAPGVKENMRQEMTRVAAEDPLIAHDYTEMRAEALRQMATPNGEEHLVDEAVQEFVSIRSDVDKHLYDDALSCVRWLSREEGVPVGILTNGNATIPFGPNATSELGTLLSISLSASEIGRSKPSRVPFLAVAQRLSVHPGRVLYIGDCYEHDIVGGHSAGMRTALLCRYQRKEVSYSSGSPTPDIELSSLDPSEVMGKITDFVLKSTSTIK